MVETVGIEASLRSFASQTFRIYMSASLCGRKPLGMDGSVRPDRGFIEKTKDCKQYNLQSFFMVETVGIEPMTSTLPVWRSPSPPGKRPLKLGELFISDIPVSIFNTRKEVIFIPCCYFDFSAKILRNKSASFLSLFIVS